MVYYLSPIDNFNDNSINTDLWDISVAGVTESSARLNIPCVSPATIIRAPAQRCSFDITKGILAAKLTRSGTATAQSEFYFGVREDTGGAYIMIKGVVNGATLSFVTGGGLTLSSVVLTDTTVGFGPSWANGTWIGIGMMGSDNIIRVYKSTTGQAWTEMARATLTGGTFNKTRCGPRYSGFVTSSTSTFVAQLDDASFFSQALVSFVFDDFNDNSIDLAKWTLDSDNTPVFFAESSAKLNVSAGSAGNFSQAFGYPKFDLRKGILAAKLSKAGSTHADVWTDVGIWDFTGNSLDILGRTTNADFSDSLSGQGTTTRTIVDTTVGFGPSWAANTWLGWSYSTVDSTIRLLKSTDTITWTEMVRYAVTVPGAMDWTRVGLTLGAANFASGSSNMVMSYDDATYFAHDQLLRSRVRVGGNWAFGLPKVRVGGAWVPARSKLRVSSAWQDVT